MGVKEDWVGLISPLTSKKHWKQPNKHKLKGNTDDIHRSQPMSRKERTENKDKMLPFDRFFAFSFSLFIFFFLFSFLKKNIRIILPDGRCGHECVVWPRFLPFYTIPCLNSDALWKWKSLCFFRQFGFHFTHSTSRW